MRHLFITLNDCLIDDLEVVDREVSESELGDVQNLIEDILHLLTQWHDDILFKDDVCLLDIATRTNRRSS